MNPRAATFTLLAVASLAAALLWQRYRAAADAPASADPAAADLSAGEVPWDTAGSVVPDVPTDAGGGMLASIEDTVRAATDALGITTPRGIRNNNPGNIIRTGTAWQGMADLQTDSRFIVFSDPGAGIRALGHVLKSYAAQGYTSVAAIISRWSATDQGAYIANVAAALGVDPQTPLDVNAALPELAAAIIRQENGIQPYPADYLTEWVRAA